MLAKMTLGDNMDRADPSYEEAKNLNPGKRYSAREQAVWSLPSALPA